MRKLLLAAVVVLAAGCSQSGAATSAHSASSPAAAASAPAPRAAATGVSHYLYVFPDGSMSVYDIDHGYRLVRHVSLPQAGSIRGVVASVVTHTLYISHGGDSPSYTGSLMAMDLLTGRILWDHSYPHGVDSLAINAAGTRIYLPDGELSGDGTWWVIDAATGNPVGQLAAGTDPHNTIIGASGRSVYLGAVHTPYLEVASTAANTVTKRIGPLRGGVRPFTVNGRETLAFTTATAFLGFQVSSITTGRVLYTESFGQRFPYDPATFAATAPSHGITLSPDERRLYVIDGPNSYVHVFDISHLPAHAPRLIANIRLRHTLTGTQAGCSFDCARDGWLLSSRSGCSVYVGDSGDVIDTRRLRIVHFIPQLRETRQFIEIDWRGGVPVSTTSRSGLGYVNGRASAPQEACR